MVNRSQSDDRHRFSQAISPTLHASSASFVAMIDDWPVKKGGVALALTWHLRGCIYACCASRRTSYEEPWTPWHCACMAHACVIGQDHGQIYITVTMLVISGQWVEEVWTQCLSSWTHSSCLSLYQFEGTAPNVHFVHWNYAQYETNTYFIIGRVAVYCGSSWMRESGGSMACNSRSSGTRRESRWYHVLHVVGRSWTSKRAVWKYPRRSKCRCSVDSGKKASVIINILASCVYIPLILHVL